MSFPKSMTPIAGCVACLAGIIWQWPGEAEGRTSHDDSATPRHQPGFQSSAAFPITASSGQPRSASKRNRLFPFHDFIPGSPEANFLRLRPDLAGQVGRWREKSIDRATLMAAGLGRKHPDILNLKKEMDELKDEILRDWDLFRPRRRIER